MKKPDLSLSFEPMFEKVSALTRTQRVLIIVLSIGLLAGGFIYFSFLPKYQTVSRLEKEYARLDKELASAKIKASQIDKFRTEMAAAQVDFAEVMKALPETKEIPSLLAAISQSGQDVGLDFLLFQPGAEKIKEFYAEIPVAIQVTGGYHNVAQFFDRVAGLRRIVTLENISLVKRQGQDTLQTACTAVTYRFVEEAAKPKKKKK
jgi:type IV pilus assembly protein PilO